MVVFPKEIVTEDFILRAVIHKCYAPKLVTLVSKNIKEFKYIPLTATLITLESANTHIDYHKEAWKKGNGYYYFIFDYNNKLMGYVGLKIRYGNKTAEVSYFLDKNQTGKGLVSKALLLLEEKFFDAGGHRLEIYANVENKKSVAVARRLNYRLDGILRQAEFFDGKFCDVAVFSKLKDDD